MIHTHNQRQQVSIPHSTSSLGNHLIHSGDSNHHRPDTAQSLNNLAGLYYNQGKYEPAETLLKRALAIREKALGHNHPHTQQTRQEYATLLHTMGRNEEAKQIEEGNGD